MMVVNQERESKRKELAQAMWRAPYSQLLRYGISSYRDITNLDTVGIPIWITHRPAAKTISVNAGKSSNDLMAFSGAIAEAIEFWAVENPWGESTTASYEDLLKVSHGDLLPFYAYPLANESLCDPNMQIEWEKVDEIIPNGEGKKFWMPSDCVWLEQRSRTQFRNWQCSSNGVASGVSAVDAVLSGLYELIERDGWTLNQRLTETLGDWPRKIPFSGLPEELDQLVQKAYAAHLYPFLFDVTSDIGIPVFGCCVFDEGSGAAGAFGGYGSSLNPVMAARRAILESFQSRLCYISAGRDDLYRRDFLLLKNADHSKALSVAKAVKPAAKDWAEFTKGYGNPVFDSIDAEFQALMSRLLAKGFTRLFSRILAEEYFSGSKFVVTRVIAPQLEGLKFEQWKTNGRAANYVRDQINNRKSQAAA